MNPCGDSTVKRIVRLLNGDIVREFYMADACLREATYLSREYHPAIRRQIAVCAAAALRNATALAAEVLALGGMPIAPRRPKQESLPEPKTTSLSPGSARRMLAHYRRRLRMAERLGLQQLREVFREIVATRERHLAHWGLIPVREPASRFILS